MNLAWWSSGEPDIYLFWATHSPQIEIVYSIRKYPTEEGYTIWKLIDGNLRRSREQVYGPYPTLEEAQAAYIMLGCADA